jgi:hypothetical protein
MYIYILYKIQVYFENLKKKTKKTTTVAQIKEN